MLLVLARLALSGLIDPEKCVPVLKSPAPVPNGRLIHAQVVLRHGARTPGENYSSIEDTGEWFCDDPQALIPRHHAAPVVYPRIYHEKFNQGIFYPPSCRKKDLITMGMVQHQELGEHFRRYLVDNLQFLSPDFQPDIIYPRSTNVDRAIKSCQSFLQGMYPPKSSNEVIQILTDVDTNRFLDPSEDYCSELIPQEDDFINSDVFKEFFDKFSAKWKETLTPVIGQWKPGLVKKFTSWVVMVDCTDHKLPSYVTRDLANDCVSFMAMWHYGQNDNDKYRGVASSTIFREIFRMADDFLAMKTPTKFVILSSHDTQIGALLPTFGQREDVPPLVRSNFLFELWDVDGAVMCRFVYNGRVLPISFLGNETLVQYSNLKGEMARLGYLNHCMIPEWKKY